MADIALLLRMWRKLIRTMSFSQVRRFLSVLLMYTFAGFAQTSIPIYCGRPSNCFLQRARSRLIPGHLVVIEHYAHFIKLHPELQARPDLQQSGKELYAFTISQSWPIYFNFDDHEILTRLYSRPGGRWVAYFVAAVLAHEAVHAKGDARESAALPEELKLDRSFYSQTNYLLDSISLRLPSNTKPL